MSVWSTLAEAIAPETVGRRRAARDRAAFVEGVDVGVDELVTSMADPVQARAFHDQFKSARAMAGSADPEMQRQGLQELASISAAVRQGLADQRDAQADRVLEAATDSRERFQRAVEPMRQLQSNAEQLNALLADPEFDVNAPLNRGTVITLLQSTTRQMLADPDDLGDAVQSVGGGGIFGALVQLVGGVMAAEDFNFTKEDVRRVADAAYTFNQQRYERTIKPLEEDAAALEKAAATLDIFPPGYSLFRYVTMNPEDFEKPLLGPGKYPETASSTPQLGKALAGGAGFVDELTGANDEQNADTELPPGDVPRDTGGGAFLRQLLLGADPTYRDLNDRVARAREDGATIMAHPDSGRLFARYDDGRREEIEIGLGERSAIRRRIQQAIKGGGGR